VTSRKRMRLVHTSDIHLGMDGINDRSFIALRAVVDAVLRLDTDMLLMVGDIFDNARVPDDLVESFIQQIGRLLVPVVVLPGNHDPYDTSSVYHREPFRSPPENLYIISSPEGETISFPGLRLSVWGKAMALHTPSFRPLGGMPSRPNGDWFIALAHGHFHGEHDRDQRSSPIFPEDIASAPCDYIALGHWDRYTDVSQGEVKACYSGAPRTIAGSSPGHVALVELDPEKGIQVHRAPL